MAADDDTQKEDEPKSVEQQVSSLLGYLQTPIKQMQNWVSSGQLQSTIDNLQERAERAQEGVERRLRALNEVRQGVQSHVKKQIEGYERRNAEQPEQPDSASLEASSGSSAEPPPARSSSAETAPKTKGSGPRKKSPGSKSAGRKR